MIEKKDSNPNPSAPSAAQGGEDENPWDDDAGGRTLAQEGPSFEMPSNIPSPITVPPPPAAAAIPRANANPVKPRSATMMGFGPPGPALPGQTGPGLPMGGGMGFTPAGGVPVSAPGGAPGTAAGPTLGASPPAPVAAPPAFPAKPFPVPPLGGGTVQASPAPPSSPDLSAAGPASSSGGPPSSNKRPPPLPPRVGALPSPPRAGGGVAAPAPRPAPMAPKAAPPAAAAPAPPPPAVISSNPPPDDDGWANAPQQEDGPTMAVASPALSGPLRDDVANPRDPAPRAPAPAPAAGRSPMASTGYRPPGTVDKDGDTMALGGNDPRLPPSLEDASRTGGDSEVEDTTRAVSREELIRHQDASFIVGQDAMGDEATLAVAPGQIDLGGQGSLAAALADSIKRESQPNLPAGTPGAPAFPGSPNFQNNAPMGSSGHLAAAAPQSSPHGPYPGMGMQHQQQQQQPWGAGGGGEQPWGAEPAPWGAEQPPPWSQPQPMGGMQQQGYDPMMPGPPQSSPNMQGYPQSGQHQLMQQQHGYGMPGGMSQGGYGPNANAGMQQRPMGMQGGGQLGPPGGQPPWMTPQASGGFSLPAKFTPQVILLVAVGAVCLAIFIIGIVLFVTTKF